MRREFIPSVEQFLNRAHKASAQYDVYFALATRFGISSGTKRDCYRICTVWADLDKNRKISECRFDPKPDILVNSGGGVHAYWLLESPLLLRGETERWKDLEAVNRALSYKFRGDKMAIDIARVLRVPGTFNHKFSPAREVRAFAV